MKYIILLISILSSTLYASIKEDSLKIIFDNHQNYIERNSENCLDIYEQLKNTYSKNKKYKEEIYLFGIYSNIIKKNFKEAILLADSATLDYVSIKNANYKRVILYKAIAYSKIGNPRISVNLLEDIADMPYEEQLLKLKVLKNLGISLFAINQYDEAFSYLLKASNLAQEIGLMDDFFDIKSLIASYYRSIGELDRSIEYLHQGLKYYLTKNDSIQIGNYYSDIGYSYLYAENIDSSKKYLRLAQSYFPNKEGSKFANQLILYSSVYVMEEKIDSALMIVKKALEINLKNNDKKGIINSYDMLHGYYLQFGNVIEDYQISIDFGKKALNLISGTKSDTLVYYPIYKNISLLYKKLDMPDSAISYYEKYILRLESIKNRYNQNTINSLLESHDIEVKDLALRYKDEQIQLQKSRNQIVGILAFILVLLLAIIYYQFKRKKDLLFKILPEKIANQVSKRSGYIGEHFDSASVIFIDVEGFTDFSKGKDPEFIIEFLNNTFQKFDSLADKHHIEKIKTIGDCYLAASGLPARREDHLINLVNFALDALDNINGFKTENGWKVNFRFGLNQGHLVAGVIGKSKFTYDIWGETVNFAARLEELGSAGKIHISKEIKDELGEKFEYEELQPKFFKGFGIVQTYYLSRKMNASN